MHPFVEFIWTPPGTHILTNGETCIEKYIKDWKIQYHVTEKDMDTVLWKEQFEVFLKTLNQKGYECLPTSKRFDKDNEANTMVVSK